ncbi:hypothetical protein [Bradyrhizobium erythrophlei]|jgi:hypothetical protein|uniref:Uncharacterized protein n=1 Tax=Bradyrhizobium erythrophlei TaxID=1437360 RepID=A0A1M5NLX7_9BRAD|nr:hypothetical protein [Bradyrhizobium erythrophlei]SHG90477.1 hypothetical protein SAMN05443248_3044 [Bradyrhizobium erythrophlei]
MTFFLLAWRASIIVTVTLMLAPLEGVFDGIETELERRGVEL